MYQPCLQFPDLVGQRDLHTAKVEWSVAFVVCISAPPDDSHSVCPCALLAFAPRTWNIVSIAKQEASRYKKTCLLLPQTHGSPVPRWLSEQTGEQHSCEYVGTKSQLTKHSKSIRLEWLLYPCSVETHGVWITLDWNMQNWQKASKSDDLVLASCSDDIAPTVFWTSCLMRPQIRRSWTCLERCACFTRYFSQTIEYHRISDFKSWSKLSFVEINIGKSQIVSDNGCRRCLRHFHGYLTCTGCQCSNL